MQHIDKLVAPATFSDAACTELSTQVARLAGRSSKKGPRVRSQPRSRLLLPTHGSEEMPGAPSRQSHAARGGKTWTTPAAECRPRRSRDMRPPRPSWRLRPPRSVGCSPRSMGRSPGSVGGSPRRVGGSPGRAGASPGNLGCSLGVCSAHSGTWGAHLGACSAHPRSLMCSPGNLGCSLGLWGAHQGTWGAHPGVWGTHPGVRGTHPERRFPPRAGTAPGILTCPLAAIGATGNVTDPGMSEAISGIQQRREVLPMPEKPGDGQGRCPGGPEAPPGGTTQGPGPGATCPSPLRELGASPAWALPRPGHSARAT